MDIWIKSLLVFTGGGLGAVCRYLLSLVIHHTGPWLGLATFIINSSACFIIGLCAGLMVHSSWSYEHKTTFILLTMTGWCGGFSTFSEFTLDSVRYFESGHIAAWFIFACATIFVGLFGCALGYWLGQRL